MCCSLLAILSSIFKDSIAALLDFLWVYKFTIIHVVFILLVEFVI